MSEDPNEILEKINDRAKRRSVVVWSGLSIAGYIWDIIRNLIVVFVVFAVYNSIYDSSDIIIVSILILMYLSVVSIGAQLGQSVARTHLQTYTHSTEILKKLGKEEDESEEEDLEKAGFVLEKLRYKFILNSVFNLIIFVIAILYPLDALS